MRTLCGFVLLCAVMTLTGAAALSGEGPDNNQTAISHLVKRSAGSGVRFNGRYFFYIPRRLSWARAERNCQSLGGNLASVHNINEYHEIQRLIVTQTHEYSEAWVGGTDALEENLWLWSDGKPFHYSDWCPGEPNNHRTQNCLLINWGATKCWDDYQCNTRFPSICVKRQ